MLTTSIEFPWKVVGRQEYGVAQNGRVPLHKSGVIVVRDFISGSSRCVPCLRITTPLVLTSIAKVVDSAASSAPLYHVDTGVLNDSTCFDKLLAIDAP
jgi:hypothetical protein